MSLSCPRCKEDLIVKTIRHPKADVEVDACPSCQGIWFDYGELQQLETLVTPVFYERRKIPPIYEQLTPLFCPYCDTHPMMEKHEHPRDAKVIFDLCEHCLGIWLDGGELEAIQQESFFSLLF